MRDGVATVGPFFSRTVKKENPTVNAPLSEETAPTHDLLATQPLDLSEIRRLLSE